MALPYPAWFTALDRRLVEQAIAAATPPDIPPPVPKPTDTVVFLSSFRGSFQTDTEAIAAVLRVFETVLHAWRRHPEHAGELAPLEAILDSLVVWADPHRPAPKSLEAFSEGVRTAAAPLLARLPRVSSSPPTAPAPDERELLPIRKAAKRLGMHEDTLKGWAKDGKAEILKIGGRLKMRPAELERLMRLPEVRYRK